MARKKVTAEEHRQIERAREIKRKAKNRKPAAGDEDEDEGKGDSVCAICDNGGRVTCCEGGCQRSFHLSDEHDDDAKCRLKLGVTEEQAKMIIEEVEKFICKNCKYRQHQCFVCGSLGSSDLSSKPEVFQCELDDCARFYHPKCVAPLLYPECEFKAELFEEQVVAEQKLTCPRHECVKCRLGENKDDYKMQFAVCRRCPTVYHWDCLPSDILFETDDGPEDAVLPRAWNKVLPDRILIYCTKHEIVKKLGTPKRNHIKFPDAGKIRVPKMLGGPPTDPDKPDEEKLLDPQPMGRDKSEKEELIAQQPIEQDKPKEQELLDQQPVHEPSQSPPSSPTNECSCSGHNDSFAPAALFMHPQPGSCGWIDD